MKVTFSEHTYFSDRIGTDPVLIDLGSCYGAFATHFLEAYPTANIVLVEPSRTNQSRILLNNPRLNSPRVEKIWKAVAATAGQILTFYEDLRSEQNGSLLFNYFNGVPYEVETVSINDLVLKFDRVDLIKMDIEGAEWEVIDSMTDETFDRVQQMTIEFHDFIDPNLRVKSDASVKKIMSHGFKIDFHPTTYKYGSQFYDSTFYR